MKSGNSNLSINDYYRQEFAKISNQALEKIIDDEATAVKYAKIGLAKTGNENPNVKTIQEYAEIMQSTAKLILNQRKEENKQITN